MTDHSPRCTAFQDDRCIASGSISEVAPVVKRASDRAGAPPVAVFDNATSEVVELDLRGSIADVRLRYPPTGKKPEQAADEGPPGAIKRGGGRGRPKLGVIPKEITLLPRHWAWLAEQRGGASATIRRLVDQARREGAGGELIQRAQDATYRFMTAMAGDLPGFEESLRALFAGDRERFEALIDGWPTDLRAHILMLVTPAFDSGAPGAQDKSGRRGL